MKVRSVTLFVPSLAEEESEPPTPVRPFFDEACNRLREVGVEVQTTRLALPPLSRALQARWDRSVADHARRAEELCRAAGAGYVSLGPIELGDDVEALGPALAAALAGTELVFASIETAADGRVSRDACAAAAAVMTALAASTDQGFGNLRFAAIAHCPPGIPFFPAAYGDGARTGFALALEAADVAVAAFQEGGTGRDPAGACAEALERVVLPLERVALGLQEEFGIAYLGADLSPAPYPSEECSIGRAIELASGAPFGAPGTLAAAAMVTRAVRSARVRRCGFSGLMLPVLEDSTLVLRSAEGRLTVDELLLYSSVCGTGLDTVPLPGDTPAAELAAIIGDVGALSAALRKPLTARLFPVPGKKAGDSVAYDFPYFAAGAAVLPIRS